MLRWPRTRCSFSSAALLGNNHAIESQLESIISTLSTLTYSKFDNCHVLDGKHHEHDHSRDEPRYKYSPTHSEPAVCCVPNYTRNLTYFLDQMWMSTKDGGIVANMFGPSKLTTTIDGSQVSIEQITNYPLSDEITFVFKIESPVKFSFYVRKPNWKHQMEGEEQFTSVEDGYYMVSKKWTNGETLTVKFDYDVEMNTANNGEVYFQRGPLVYAYEIPHSEKTIKSYENSVFKDYYCFPKDDTYKYLRLNETKLTVNSDPKAKGFYDSQLELSGTFISEDNSELPISLVPMGKTVLRRVTFPKIQE